VINALVEGQVVAELRQKSVKIGHQLLVDFSMGTAGRLDRRLGQAAHLGAAESV